MGIVTPLQALAGRVYDPLASDLRHAGTSAVRISLRHTGRGSQIDRIDSSQVVTT